MMPFFIIIYKLLVCLIYEIDNMLNELVMIANVQHFGLILEHFNMLEQKTLLLPSIKIVIPSSVI